MFNSKHCFPWPHNHNIFQGTALTDTKKMLPRPRLHSAVSGVSDLRARSPWFDTQSSHIFFFSPSAGLRRAVVSYWQNFCTVLVSKFIHGFGHQPITQKIQTYIYQTHSTCMTLFNNLSFSVLFFKSIVHVYTCIQS